MPDKEQDDMLREAARARGFRLVKSRRRKPGGDFGKYGLVELKSGRECFGFGDKGLTGTPDEVLAYLRGGEVASWKRSLIGAVGGAEKTGSPKPSAPPERSRRASAPTQDRDAKKAENPTRKSQKRSSTSLRTSREAKEIAEPTLRVAKRGDAAAIAKLLGVKPAPLAERLSAVLDAGEAPMLAERDGLVGVIAWTVVRLLDEPPRGRVTMLHVAEDLRREGIGGRLLAAAENQLAKAGVTRVEMLLNIDLDAPTGFLRRTGWDRFTNGYAKDVSA